MIVKISKTQEIREKLHQDRKVTYLDNVKDVKAMKIVNKEMEEIRREFKVKERNSQVSAANVLLTA